MSDQNQELAAVLARLKSFETKMDAAIAHAQSRKNLTLVLMIVVIIAMIGYLTFAHNQIKKVDASTVVYLAEAKVQELLDQSAPQLTKTLEDHAPEAIAMAEARLVALPEAIGQQGRAFMIQKVTAGIPDLESHLQTELAGAIKEAHARHSDDGKPMDDEQLKQVIEQLAAAYGQQLQEMATTLHQQYRTNSAELMDYLRVLAEADEGALDERQKLQRGLIVSLMSLVEHHGDDINALPGQNAE